MRCMRRQVYGRPPCGQFSDPGFQPTCAVPRGIPLTRPERSGGHGHWKANTKITRNEKFFRKKKNLKNNLIKSFKENFEKYF
jgi:hypothetical protein